MEQDVRGEIILKHLIIDQSLSDSESFLLALFKMKPFSCLLFALITPLFTSLSIN
jgi:hypothetical protein